MLHNLVQNAMAYSDPAQPERRVRLGYRYDEDRKCRRVMVEDNGVGIPEGEQQLVFQRFRRGSGARGQGLGLGLSIVREAARS